MSSRLALLLLALLSCSREERAPSPTPTPTPEPASAPEPAPASAPDATPGCDETALLAAARAVAACKQDTDCTLTHFTDCWVGNQKCGMLAHARTADLATYRAPLDAWHSTCPTRSRCRCATPETAVCQAGLCVTAP